MSVAPAEMIVAPRTGAWRGSTLAVVLCLPALLPLVVIAFALVSPETGVWAHLARYVLPEVVANTIKLVIGVALVAGALGTSLAWLTAMCDFPGRRWLEWALLLPLAIPAYVLAFVAIGFLDYAGPLQTALRSAFGTSSWVPPIRSTGGVILVLSLAFYPYVYLMARNAFLTQGRRVLEVAQTFGYSRSAAIWRVALPMAKPWIAGGIALICMEALADFGAVSIFNYNTFTTAIYRAWFGLFSVHAALELSAVLLAFVLIALFFDRRSRAGVRYAASRDLSRHARAPLGSRTRWFASLYAGGVLAVAFVLPLLQLLWWAVKRAGRDLDARYWMFTMHSLVLAASAAIVIVGASLVLAYLLRRQPSMFNHATVRLATVGYAVPGTVLAVGTLFPLVMLNNALQGLLSEVFGASAPTLLLQSTVIGVLLAYMARFLAVGLHPIESGLQRVTRSLDEAAIGLGVNGTRLVRSVHVPLLRSSLVTAAIMVFVDVMKEMPITLLTRPFGWDTLAIRVFNMTSIGEWERAALPSVVIVAVGLIPAAMLSRGNAHVA
ncbi:MAG TPA: iron ABC transporter permease [Povalibacter sp.]|uniref:ABC transporter permease n=1 Tax=Povalibacter sp. TaxID=1962978 RepID=UPI002C3BB381|nr:iron ABC transporter permease [Povalibacter sp.]HMN45354.1 iron ABC transporter permease [Povalibacter sp.]